MTVAKVCPGAMTGGRTSASGTTAWEGVTIWLMLFGITGFQPVPVAFEVSNLKHGLETRDTTTSPDYVLGFKNRGRYVVRGCVCNSSKSE